MARVDLYNLAREFAHDVNHLLNHTVCDGARLVAGTNPVTGHCVIAPRVDRLGRPTEESVPLRLGRRRPTGHLTVLFTTQLDPEEQYLAVDKSRFGLCLDPDGDARGCCCTTTTSESRTTCTRAPTFRSAGSARCFTRGVTG